MDPATERLLTPNTVDFADDELEKAILYSYQDREISSKHKLGTFAVANLIVSKTVGTGILSVPSYVYAASGSVGMSLCLWTLGALTSFCGMQVYADLGSALPFSGGERIYLERIFRRPKLLATYMFMTFTVILGSSAPPCVVLGQYVLFALEIEPTPLLVRTIGTLAISLVCLLQSYHPRIIKGMINLFGVSKLLFVLLILGSALASRFLGNVHGQEAANAVPLDIWGNTSFDLYNLGTAFLQIMYCFRGYNAVSQIIQEVKQPQKSLNVGMPLAFGVVTASYLLVNISYFAIVEAKDLHESGVLVAGHFFKNIYGEVFGRQILSLAVIICTLGSVAANAYTQARVNQELGKDGILPFPSLWVEHSFTANTATTGIFLHWIVTVAVIIVPPTDDIYRFLVSLSSYPVSLLCAALSFGLLYLQLFSSPAWSSPLPASKMSVACFGIANLVLLVLPWIRPNEVDCGSSKFEYYMYPAAGLAVTLSGAVYYAATRLRNDR